VTDTPIAPATRLGVDAAARFEGRTVSDEFDVIVIGAGSPGEHFVGKSTAAGLSTAIIESELFGGDCSYWACIPSKTLLRPGRALAAARAVPGAREAVSGSIDSVAALGRRNEMVSNWNDAGQVEWVTNTGATFLRGHGRLAGERTVIVDGPDGTTRQLTARRAVVIASGSSSAVPPITGLAKARHWDNRQATSAQAVPRRLIVLGGGPVGCELAQAWKRLGSEEVSLIELAERLLPSSEPFAGEILAEALRRDGINLFLGRGASEVARPDPDGPVAVILADGTRLEGDELLVCVGRRPRTDDIGLETVGLEAGKPIEVDEHLRAVGVADDWLYAIGDVNWKALLTHMGKYQGRIAARVIAGEEVADEADGRAVTSVVFTDPQVAEVGMTEKRARDKRIDVAVFRVDINSVAAASIEGSDVVGAAQLVIDRASETIVGATFVGPDIGEMLHSATIAVIGRVPIELLRHAVAAFPSLSEIWLELIEGYVAESSKS
jgi:pyruvate/2-oxoglutarate dehydrogenase complex dihydrolipoamide dehydrogenase (E3) component